MLSYKFQAKSNIFHRNPKESNLDILELYALNRIIKSVSTSILMSKFWLMTLIFFPLILYNFSSSNDKSRKFYLGRDRSTTLYLVCQCNLERRKDQRHKFAAVQLNNLRKLCSVHLLVVQLILIFNQGLLLPTEVYAVFIVS